MTTIRELLSQLEPPSHHSKAGQVLDGLDGNGFSVADLAQVILGCLERLEEAGYQNDLLLRLPPTLREIPSTTPLNDLLSTARRHWASLPEEARESLGLMIRLDTESLGPEASNFKGALFLACTRIGYLATEAASPSPLDPDKEPS